LPCWNPPPPPPPPPRRSYSIDPLLARGKGHAVAAAAAHRLRLVPTTTEAFALPDDLDDFDAIVVRAGVMLHTFCRGFRCERTCRVSLHC